MSLDKRECKRLRDGDMDDVALLELLDFELRREDDTALVNQEAKRRKLIHDDHGEHKGEENDGDNGHGYYDFNYYDAPEDDHGAAAAVVHPKPPRPSAAAAA